MNLHHLSLQLMQQQFLNLCTQMSRATMTILPPPGLVPGLQAPGKYSNKLPDNLFKATTPEVLFTPMLDHQTSRMGVTSAAGPTLCQVTGQVTETVMTTSAAPARRRKAVFWEDSLEGRISDD